MKSIKDFLVESIKDIQTSNLEQWINDDKLVETYDKRQVIVKNIDLSVYPNKILGCVKIKDSLFDFEWNLKGECLKATDEFGNPKEPEEKDYLVKKLTESLNESKNVLYRCNTSLDSERNIYKVLDFEINELGNNDILEYCLDNYNLSEELKERINDFFDNREDDVLTDNTLIKDLINEISKLTGKKLKYCIWLASKEAVEELYDGKEEGNKIEEYDISDGVILSDLDFDGKLFAFENNP